MLSGFQWECAITWLMQRMQHGPQLDMQSLQFQLSFLTYITEPLKGHGRKKNEDELLRNLAKVHRKAYHTATS